MTTENEGLYTSTDNATDPNATEAGKDGANNPNQSMDTLPLGEGVAATWGHDVWGRAEGATPAGGLLKLTDALLQRSKASGNVVLSSNTQALELG